MNNFNLKIDITWRDFLIRVGLVIVSVAIITSTLPRDTNNTFKVEKGKPWNYADLRAPFDFPILKTDEAVKAERDSLLQQYEPYFNLNKQTEGEQIRQFVKDYNQGIPGISNDYISIIANRLHAIYQHGIMKPDLAFFKKVLDTERILPEETLFVDDGWRNVEAARQLSIQTFCPKNGEDWTKEIYEYL